MNLLKKILTFTEIVYQLKNKKVFDKPIEERYSEFKNFGKKINSNNFIYQYKTEGKRPEDFSIHQIQIYLII